MTTLQDRRYLDLASRGDYAAVAATPLAGGLLSLVCRNAKGDVLHAELVDAGGRTLLPDEALQTLTAARAQAQAQADQALNDAVIHLALGQADPDRDVNIAQVAEDLGVARGTVYNRVRKTTVAPA